ncbi:MAG: NADH-quinone oxidoreductase subunit J [Opitutales bacterium]
MDTVLFYIFSALCVGGGLAVLMLNGYVNSAMAMLCSMLGLAGLSFLANAYILALLIIMVYAGAITVLFVFTIIMMGEDGVANSTMKDRAKMFVMFLLGACLLAFFTPRIAEFYSADGFGLISFKEFSAQLYSKYILAVEVVGVLLLVAVVAVVAIAKETRKR